MEYNPTHSIYVLKDPRNGDVRYVGETCNPPKRLRGHINNARAGKNGPRGEWICELLDANLRPKMDVVEQCDFSERHEREDYWMKKCEKEGADLLNTAPAGGGPGRHSEETKEKMSKMAKERFSVPENNTFYGKHHTEEAKNAIGSANKGNKQWKNWWDSLSDKEKKQRISEKSEAVVGKNNPMYGVELSKEQRQHLQKTTRESWEDKETRVDRMEGMYKRGPYEGEYKGVFKKRKNKYLSHIQHENKTIYLGTFSSSDKAAVIYDKKALELFGTSAYTNILNSNGKYYIKCGRFELECEAPPFPRVTTDKRKRGPKNGEYKGVSKTRAGTWRARIWDPENKKQLYLGRYKIKAEAAKAYDKEALKLFGPEAYFNFPEELEVGDPSP